MSGRDRYSTNRTQGTETADQFGQAILAVLDGEGVLLAPVGAKPAAGVPLAGPVDAHVGDRLELCNCVHSCASSLSHQDVPVARGAFDEVFDRIKTAGQEYWAYAGLRASGEINHNDGGRGVYRQDPDGHVLELITRPYGSGAATP
jgi:catechol 2,3-dioxygenase-like lactoylglutathione lyase family enzyme